MKNKLLLIYIIFLKILVFLFIIKEFFKNNYYIGLLFTLVLLIFIFSYKLLKNKLNLKVLFCFEILTYLLILAYEFNSLYHDIPFWDTGMHAFTGFIAVIFILMVFIYLKKKNKFKKLYPFLISFLGFCFSLTIGVLFEINEYTFDKLLDRDMQKDMIIDNIKTVKFKDEENKKIEIDNIKKTVVYYEKDEVIREFIIENGYLDIGINDTMKDLYVNLIGSLLGSLYVFLFLKENNLKIK